MRGMIGATLAAMLVLSGCRATPAGELPAPPPVAASWGVVVAAFSATEAFTLEGTVFGGAPSGTSFRLVVDRTDGCRWTLERWIDAGDPSVTIGDDGAVQAVRSDGRWLVQVDAAPLPGGLRQVLSSNPCRLLDGISRYSSLGGQGAVREVALDPEAHRRWLVADRTRHAVELLRRSGRDADPLTIAERSTPADFETAGAHLTPVTLDLEGTLPARLTVGVAATYGFLDVVFAYGATEGGIPRVEDLVELDGRDLGGLVSSQGTRVGLEPAGAAPPASTRRAALAAPSGRHVGSIDGALEDQVMCGHEPLRWNDVGGSLGTGCDIRRAG